MRNLLFAMIFFSSAAFAQMPGRMSMSRQCPMGVKGAQVAAADTENGVSLTFTAGKAGVREVRNRAKRMSEMMAERMFDAAAVYERVPNGARVTFAPKDPSQLAVLRQKVREHAEGMKSGNCCMNGDMCGEMHGSMGKPGSMRKP